MRSSVQKNYEKKKPPMWRANMTLGLGPICQNTHKFLKRINCGDIFAKYAKMDEILLNEIISVKNVKMGDKNRNSRTM